MTRLAFDEKAQERIAHACADWFPLVFLAGFAVVILVIVAVWR